MTTLSQQDASFANMSQKLQQTHIGDKQTKTTSYQNKKLGDLMNEMDGLLARKRYDMRYAMTQQVKQVLQELQTIYEEIEDMVNHKETPDPAYVLAKQLLLNDIENHAVQGIYGVQGQIKPLCDKELEQHIIMQVIPPGQATIRDLIERCHQLVTRLLDRVDASHELSKKFSYDNKKLGDLMDEIDIRFSSPSKGAKTKVKELLTQLHILHEEMKKMVQQKTVDLDTLTVTQQRLNELENQACFGVYGLQAQIPPLHHVGEQPHHVRMEPIPEGQATIRGLIERCHQLQTRIMDRTENAQLRKKRVSCC